MPQSVDPKPFVRRHRTLFLSDLHLGSFGSRADLVLEFLARNNADTYLLVGDIIDSAPSVLSRWSASDQAVVDLLRLRMEAGARVVYVRGNHDPIDAVAEADQRLPVSPVDRAEHVAADGRRYLVVHGDGQDRRLFRWHVLTRIGSQADQVLRAADALIGQYVGTYVRSGATERRSVIEALLSLVNRGFYPGRPHERRLVGLARAGGFDGVICGHYHIPELRDLNGLRYANCGDWIDSFTALGEDDSGGLRLLGGRAAFAASPRPTFREAMARA